MDLIRVRAEVLRYSATVTLGGGFRRAKPTGEDFMDPRIVPLPIDEDVNGYDVVAVLPSIAYAQSTTRTRDTLREIQRRLTPHRAALEVLRKEEVAFQAFLEAFNWSWAIARSTDSPTMREAAYVSLLHSLPHPSSADNELDAATRLAMFARLAQFDERHLVLLNELKAGRATAPNDPATAMHQVCRELMHAGYVDAGKVTPLGERFWRFVMEG